VTACGVLLPATASLGCSLVCAGSRSARSVLSLVEIWYDEQSVVVLALAVTLYIRFYRYSYTVGAAHKVELDLYSSVAL
jgi:hypothetical protein